MSQIDEEIDALSLLRLRLKGSLEGKGDLPDHEDTLKIIHAYFVQFIYMNGEDVK
ncbi:MAG: hypothetical protein ABIE43_02780 [Patescibacteria group bacterium]